MKIKSAEFVISNSDVSKCPEASCRNMPLLAAVMWENLPLSNALTNRKDLAKTSGRPGKTQLINHFLINKEWYLVDLPGYGYARVSKSAKKTFQKFITAYFEKREQMLCAFVLIDSRHKPQPIDLEFMSMAGRTPGAFLHHLYQSR